MSTTTVTLTSETTASPLEQSTLCLACKSIFTSETARNESGEVSHHSLEDLAARATRGCHLCLTVYMSIDPEAYKNFRKDSIVDTLGFARLLPIAHDQARLKFRYAKPGAAGEDVASTTSSKSSLSLKTPENLTVEMLLMNPKNATEPTVRTINVKSVSTSSPESFEIARKWIDDCSMGHMKCSVADQGAIWKPKHLLDVTVRGPGGKPGVKLVDGMFIDPLAEYVTLSHCWGRSKPVRLHKSTLPALRQGVAVTNLPKTLGEAAIATERLGYRYLWIDALCIMHDNEQEVLQEISQMHKVYGEATLNLAAAASREDTSGLFYTRNVAALQPCVVSVKSVGIEDGIYKCLRSTIWPDLVDSSPLARRAWAFQERCLAKRTLFFTRNELLWECQQVSCSEVFPKGFPGSLSGGRSADDLKSFNKRTHHQRHGNWTQLVSQYSPGRLTYSSDKLVAISGLVRQYIARNRLKEEDYVAGLWKPQLPQALLWRAEKGRRPTKYRAPTWSWASVDGDITYPDTVQNGKETSIEIIDIQIKNKSDRLGQVESARLKIRGFMARGLLRRTREYWGRTPCVVDCGPTQIELVHAFFDDRLSKLSEANDRLTETLEIYMLPVVDNIDRVEGMLLSATLKKGDFRRIGVFEVTRNDNANWDKFRGIMKGDPAMSNYEERLDHTNGYWFASDYTYTINLI